MISWEAHDTLWANDSVENCQVLGFISLRINNCFENSTIDHNHQKIKSKSINLPQILKKCYLLPSFNFLEKKAIREMRWQQNKEENCVKLGWSDNFGGKTHLSTHNVSSDAASKWRSCTYLPPNSLKKFFSFQWLHTESMILLNWKPA